MTDRFVFHYSGCCSDSLFSRSDLEHSAGFQVDTAVSSLETHGIQALDVETYDYIPSRLFQSFP